MSTEHTAAPAREQLIDLMQFVEFTNRFRAMERVIWFKGVRGPERNGEHSFQLAMCAWFLNERLSLGLDVPHLLSYALVHDLVEVYAEDTPAFVNLMTFESASQSGAITRKNKAERESKAMERIRREWGEAFPQMVEYMERYERQTDRESRFIYALDKLVAGLNVYEDGGSTYRKLGLTLEMVDTYQRPKIEKDATILALYNELYTLMTKWEETNGYDLFGSILPGSIRTSGPL